MMTWIEGEHNDKWPEDAEGRAFHWGRFFGGKVDKAMADLNAAGCPFVLVVDEDNTLDGVFHIVNGDRGALDIMIAHGLVELNAVWGEASRKQLPQAILRFALFVLIGTGIAYFIIAILPFFLID